jgi:homoserine dehydrogenase
MSALALAAPAPAASAATARVAVLGTGTVGGALLDRLQRQRGGTNVALVAIANSRVARFGPLASHADAAGDDDPADAAVRALGHDGLRIIVDATPSDAVAARHAPWLDAGIHVVTACKLGQGAQLSRWQAIRDARLRTGACYGDSATVGAGLPLLRSLRALRAGGDRIHAFAGVLSGSLAWLLDAQRRTARPFASLLQDAAARGFTEPDPGEDLGGEDVRRKLLILARAAGFALAHDAVRVEPVPLAAMDQRGRDARAARRRLAYVARFACAGDGRLDAGARLEALADDDPLSVGGGTDNRLAIWCDRYPGQPLLLQGPGAGAGVTAAALLDDVLHIVRSAADPSAVPA